MNKRQSAIVRIIVFSITAVILIGILAAGLTGHFFIGNFVLFGSSGGDYYSNPGGYHSGGTKLPAGDISEIEVNWLDGSVNVSSYDGDTIQFEEHSKKNLKDQEQLRYKSKNGKLIIQYRKSKSTPFFSAGRSLQKELEIRIPEKTAKNLRNLTIDAVSSETEVTGVKAGDLNYDTVSGGMTLLDSTAKELIFSSTSGSLKGDKVTVSDKMTADTVSGTVDITGSVNRADFDSTSGSLTIDSQICPGNVNTDTVSGSVTLMIPENKGFSYSQDAVSKSFDCDFEVSHLGDSGKYKDGSADFSFESVSGSVKIRKK